jgi:nicotinate-nucleotide adenylyltransferase
MSTNSSACCLHWPMAHRTGLFGGTFNPVHRGHIEAGLQLMRLFHLDRVLYILAARPPHKKDQPVAPAQTRWRMLQQALSAHPGLEPCDVELRRDGESWTIDTLAILAREFPGDTFYFVSGSDGFLTIPTWKRYRDVLAGVVHVIILRRPEHEGPVRSLLQHEGIPVYAAADTAVSAPPAAILCRYGSPYLDLSATAIRCRLKAGQDIGADVDPAVKTMLEELKLYAT